MVSVQYDEGAASSRFSLLLLFICLGLVFSFPKDPALAQDAAAEEGEDSQEEQEELDDQVSAKDGIDIFCESNVFFSWRREPVANDGNMAATAEETEEVYFTTVGERGVRMEATKNRLLSKLPSIETAALNECRKLHQDLSQCVATNLRSHSQQYTTMDFKARGALLEAINVDCSRNIGTCTGSRSSAPRCYLNPPPDSPQKKAAEDEKKKKDDKK